MLNCLHVADVHLGAKFAKLGPKGSEQRKRLEDAFSKIPQITKEKKVQLVLIAGDLFDSPFPSNASVSLVNSVFKELAGQGVYVVVSAGNHDYLASGSVYLTGRIDTKPDQIHVFTNPKPETYTIPNLKAAVAARSLDSDRSHHSPLADLKPDPKAEVNIAMAHGSVEIPGLKVPKDSWLMKQEEIQNAPFDYVALGDWHGMKEIVKDKAWYPGAPEWISSDQKLSGNVLFVSIDGGSAAVSPIVVGTTEFDQIEIELGTVKTIDELKERIIKDSEKTLIREVTLKGIRSTDSELTFDVKALEEELAVDFWDLKIIDKSVLKVAEENTSDKTLISQFVKQMSEKSEQIPEEDKKREVEEATWIGLRLLQGKEAGL